MTIQSDSVLPAALRDRWPYAPRYANVNGWRMHYVDEGEGDPVVLLHGNPTWGFLYRDMIAPLVSSGRRVIVPDMIGFGLSEKPTREQAHCLDGHTANLTALMRQLDLKRITLVCHDWGGPTGLSFRHEQSRSRSCAHDHEHLGMAHAAGRISHPHFSMADDACPADRPLSPGKSSRARRPRRLSLCG